jgi:hypothetical protein
LMPRPLQTLNLGSLPFTRKNYALCNQEIYDYNS